MVTENKVVKEYLSSIINGSGGYNWTKSIESRFRGDIALEVAEFTINCLGNASDKNATKVIYQILKSRNKKKKDHIKNSIINLLMTLSNACDVEFEDEELAIDLINKFITNLMEYAKEIQSDSENC